MCTGFPAGDRILRRRDVRHQQLSGIQFPQPGDKFRTCQATGPAARRSVYGNDVHTQ